MRSLFPLVFLGIMGINSHTYGACETLVRGPIAFDVQQCIAVSPEQSFPFTDPRYAFIRDLPPSNRAQYLDTYRGLILRGKVVRSMAVRSGLSPEQGALGGEVVSVFIAPKVTDCNAVNGKRVQGQLDQICCEGGGVAPCLLGTGYILNKPQTTGAATVVGKHSIRAQGAAKQGYQQAAAAMAKHDFQGAAKILESLREKRMIDTQGEFLLGASYRELDECPRAIPPLEAIFSKFEKSNFWADDEVYIRKGTMLLARCYAMMGQPGDSVMVLKSFLVEPKKFQREIAESLSHADFGGIRTDKAYLTYESQARKLLRSSQ